MSPRGLFQLNASAVTRVGSCLALLVVMLAASACGSTAPPRKPPDLKPARAFDRFPLYWVGERFSGPPPQSSRPRHSHVCLAHLRHVRTGTGLRALQLPATARDPDQADLRHPLGRRPKERLAHPRRTRRRARRRSCAADQPRPGEGVLLRARPRPASAPRPEIAQRRATGARTRRTRCPLRRRTNGRRGPATPGLDNARRELGSNAGELRPGTAESFLDSRRSPLVDRALGERRRAAVQTSDPRLPNPHRLPL